MPAPNVAVPMAQRKAMPMQARALPVTSVDKEKRTCRIVFSTGAAVPRRDWWTGERYMEELSLDPAHVRMDRFKNGAVNLIDTHNQWSLSAILGICETATVDGSIGETEARFSKRDDVEPYFQDVVDGIIRNVSVGYIVHRYEKIDPPANSSELPIWRAIDWEPAEVSLCAVNADAGAGTRSNNPHESPDGQRIEPRTYPCEFIIPAPAGATPTNHEETPTMIRKHNVLQAPEGEGTAGGAAPATTTRTDGGTPPAGAPATPPAGVPAVTEAQRQQILEQEATRVATITQRCQAAGLDATFTATLTADRNITPEVASERIMQALVQRQSTGRPVGVHDIRITRDQTDVVRAGIQEAIAHRAAPHFTPLTDAGRQYRGMNLVDMARDAIERAGGNTRGLSRREIAVIALNLDRDLAGRAGMQSTSDFTNILGNTVNRSLRAGYELNPRTFTGWARMSTAPDFRQVSRTQLSEASAFQKINEGGEYKAITFGDSAEKYALAKFGGIVAITWETIINDDLDAFDRVPRAIGDEAAATEGDVVYGVLLANANLADGVALFHATHGNLMSAAGISDVTLGLGRAAMRKQTGLKGRVLNLSPDFLVVGPDKESEANKYTSAQFVAAKSSDINPNYNTSLEVVVEPRVTGNKWFMMATPGRCDTVEYAYLEGEQGVFIETKQGWEVDGLMVKGRLAFAAKAIDHRGMQYNPGA